MRRDRLDGGGGRCGGLRCWGCGRGRWREGDGGLGRLACVFVGFVGVGLRVVEGLRGGLGGLEGSWCRLLRPTGRHFC